MTKDRTGAARQQRLRNRLKAGEGYLLRARLHPHEKAALDTLTAGGRTVRDAVGGAIVNEAKRKGE